MPNDPNATLKEDQSGELFEEENEQFIHNLDTTLDTDPSVEEIALLDQLVPDVEPEPEPSAIEGAPEAKAAEEATQQESRCDSESVEEPAEPVSALNNLPIAISLELGKVSCSLQKLVDLRENDLLELNQSLGQVIDLRVEGRLIGRGEIVRLGDQLGLRISELVGR